MFFEAGGKDQRRASTNDTRINEECRQQQAAHVLGGKGAIAGRSKELLRKLVGKLGGDHHVGKQRPMLDDDSALRRSKAPRVFRAGKGRNQRAQKYFQTPLDNPVLFR
jgi:hypothetical protein